jgi:hypothetical protein
MLIASKNWWCARVEWKRNWLFFKFRGGHEDIAKWASSVRDALNNLPIEEGANFTYEGLQYRIKLLPQRTRVIVIKNGNPIVNANYMTFFMNLEALATTAGVMSTLQDNEEQQ